MGTWRSHTLILVDPDRIDEPDSENMVRLYKIGFSKGRGVNICASVVVGDLEEKETTKRYNKILNQGYYNSNDSKLNAFQEVIVSNSLYSGARQLIQTCGIGKLRPNIICLGPLRQWQEEEEEKRKQYIKIVKDTFFLEKGIIIPYLNKNPIPSKEEIKLK